MKYKDIIIKSFIKISLIFISFICFLIPGYLLVTSLYWHYYTGQSKLIDALTSLFCLAFLSIPFFGWYVIIPIIFNIYYLNKKEKVAFNIISIIIHLLILFYVLWWWITGQKFINRMF